MGRRLGVVAAVLVAVVVAAAVGIVALDDGPDDEGAPAPHPSPPTSTPSPQELTSFSLDTDLVTVDRRGGELQDGRSAPKVNVLLPEGYAENPDETYPVLWLLHGASGGADSWVPGIEQLARGLPAIVVMPDGGRFGMYVDWWSDGARGDPAWTTFHLRELRGEIESRYRVRPGRRWHAIAGISMGGQGALRYAALLPGYFGSVATFSAAVPDMQSGAAEGATTAFAGGRGGGTTTYDDVFGPPQGAYAEGNSPQALAPNLAHTRVFLTSGDGTNCPQDPVNPDSIEIDVATETVINAQQGPFVDALRAAGAEVAATTTCGVHTFGVWDRAFAAARDWGFFGAVPVEPAEWTYRSVAPAGEAWGISFSFATPPEAVTTFSLSDGVVQGTGTGTVTIDDGASGPVEVRLPFSRPLGA